MENMMMGPLWGVVTVAVVVGVVNIGCWIAMAKMLWHPGEKDLHHPKYDILRADR